MNHCMQPITTILLVQLPKQVSQETQVRTLHTLHTKNHVSHSHFQKYYDLILKWNITQLQAALALVQHNVACDGKQLCGNETYRAATQACTNSGCQITTAPKLFMAEFRIFFSYITTATWATSFNLSFPPFICIPFLFVQPIIIPVPTPLAKGISTSLATADDSTLALLCSVFSKLKATG